MALMHDMGTHRGSGGFAMRTCYTESFVRLGQRTQHLSTLLYLEAILLEIAQFLMLCGDGWRIDNQTFLCVLTGLWNLIDIFFIVDEHSFLFQLTCQVGWGLVVTSDDKAFVQEVSCDGTHADASCTYEID